MTKEKLAQFVQRLLELSKKGLVNWETSPVSDKFVAQFNGYSVAVEYTASHDEDSDEHSIDLYNKDGERIDTFWPFAIGLGREGTAIFRELYSEARGHALGLDAAVDNLLGQFAEAEDEIPF